MQHIERVFATNCVGHQVLATSLLPLLKNGATPRSDARIVVTSSSFIFGANILTWIFCSHHHASSGPPCAMEHGAMAGQNWATSSLLKSSVGGFWMIKTQRAS
ncbi:hypothetical protein N7491_002168 [Penicillium cf. griseofulvum]|nr:hypothetical protein N7491_002168 [Penicillium cf. griseofulvum]KAJ5447826.1 hypothetical protein N7445_002647 [Penicillium cf. griseofulvum]